MTLRILGRSDTPEYDNRAAVYATGNNVGVLDDMTRRVLFCNLDARVERPELREFDRNPLEMVRANRGLYIAAVLTIIRAYIRAGTPSLCPPIGSYRQWDRMVRSALVWLGLKDPVKSMENARDYDPVLSNIRELFSPRWLVVGREFSSRDLVNKAANDDDLKDLLLGVADDGRGAISNNRVGRWLQRISKRVVDGRYLVVDKSSTKGAKFTLAETAL